MVAQHEVGELAAEREGDAVHRAEQAAIVDLGEVVRLRTGEGHLLTQHHLGVHRGTDRGRQHHRVDVHLGSRRFGRDRFDHDPVDHCTIEPDTAAVAS